MRHHFGAHKLVVDISLPAHCACYCFFEEDEGFANLFVKSQQSRCVLGFDFSAFDELFQKFFGVVTLNFTKTTAADY